MFHVFKHALESSWVFRLDDLYRGRGRRVAVSSLKLDKCYPPDGGLMAKLNESVLTVQVWLDEERAITNSQKRGTEKIPAYGTG